MDYKPYKPSLDEMTPPPVNVSGFYAAIRGYKGTANCPDNNEEERLQAAYLELIEAEYQNILRKLAEDHSFGTIHPRAWDDKHECEY